MVSEFDKVNVVKQANIYFDGMVTSRTVKFADGSVKSLGFMMPGEYRFTTADREDMEILSGELEVLLPERSEWIKVQGGESFQVPANSAFDVKIHKPTDYCCSYLKD